MVLGGYRGPSGRKILVVAQYPNRWPGPGVWTLFGAYPLNANGVTSYQPGATSPRNGVPVVTPSANGAFHPPSSSIPHVSFVERDVVPLQ